MGTRAATWINEGFAEYSKRMPHDFQFNLIEIPTQHRSKNANTNQILLDEGTQLFSKIPKNNKIIALDVEGLKINTNQLAQQLQYWHNESYDLSFLIGGPEGLSQPCLEKADMKLSLSPLTFPHPLVRLILAEQLYRAWTILTNHPYHRN